MNTEKVTKKIIRTPKKTVIEKVTEISEDEKVTKKVIKKVTKTPKKTVTETVIEISNKRVSKKIIKKITKNSKKAVTTKTLKKIVQSNQSNQNIPMIDFFSDHLSLEEIKKLKKMAKELRKGSKK